MNTELSQEERRAKRAKYQRDRRAALKSQGKCIMCGEYTIPGKSRCNKCLQAARDYSRQRAKRLFAQGLCIYCAQPRGNKSVCYCDSCRKKFSDYQRKRRKDEKQ